MKHAEMSAHRILEVSLFGRSCEDAFALMAWWELVSLRVYFVSCTRWPLA